ncbi:vacuolar protein sorting-associated protein 4B-like [Anabrus simplex]|uniref:vacuolar protein sorting-associated protein 4B-like n=1 Tax=Anabrus simplex TaxID=316456 RepID=UPI0035A377AA
MSKDSLSQVSYQITYQRKVLTDKILKQYNQEESNCLEDNGDIDPPPSVSDEPGRTSSAMETNNQTSDLDDGRIENRRNTIAAMKKDPGTGGLDSIAGLSVAKQLLREAVVLPMRFPHLFTGGRRAWNRVLLYGPPGTGKTKLAQAIASEMSVAFYCVSSADILSCWVGESEKLIRELFQYTRSNREQSIIFIDEVDGLCRKRTSHEEDRSRRLKNQFLTLLENTSATQQDTIFLLCATNCPWELDSAFLRRFQRRIYISLPDRSARYQILTLHSKGVETNMSDADWQLLLDRTEGYSGSDLANLALSALMEPVREIDNSTHWNFTPSFFCCFN